MPEDYATPPVAADRTQPSVPPPPLPRWFGPRASPDDPAVSALIARVARGAGWADIGGAFNLNVRIDAEPPVVLRVHRPWARRGRVAGLRRLRERLQQTQVRVARPIPISGCDLLRAAGRWAETEEFIDHVQPRADEDSYVRLFEELGRFHTALKAVWEPGPPEPLDDHRTFGQLRYSVGFTRRRLGPLSEPVVQRMRQLTGELSRLRNGLELPCAPIHGDFKLGNAGELPDGSWATFDLDFARVRERLYDIAGSLNHVARSGPDGVGPPARFARAATTARRLRAHGTGTARLATSTVGSPGLWPSYRCTGLPPQGSWATASRRPRAQ